MRGKWEDWIDKIDLFRETKSLDLDKDTSIYSSTCHNMYTVHFISWQLKMLKSLNNFTAPIKGVIKTDCKTFQDKKIHQNLN